MSTLELTVAHAPKNKKSFRQKYNKIKNQDSSQDKAKSLSLKILFFPIKTDTRQNTYLVFSKFPKKQDYFYLFIPHQRTAPLTTPYFYIRESGGQEHLTFTTK